MTFPLPVDFQALVRREPYGEPALTGRAAMGRSVLIVAGALLGAALLAQLPARPFYRAHPSPHHDLAQLAFAVGMAVLVSGYFVYTAAWRPW